MCFNVKQTKNIAQIERRFKANLRPNETIVQSDQINGFTFPKLLVISNKESSVIQNFNWGLIPNWANDSDIRKYTLNARIETLDQKPSFKQSVNKRCLILVDGFYEWQWLDQKGRNKQKFLLETQDKASFALGGIWSEWVDQTTGEIIKSFSIVTTQAKGIMNEIHNSKHRMPVMLTPQNEMDWLNHAPLHNFLDLNLELKATKI